MANNNETIEIYDGTFKMYPQVNGTAKESNDTSNVYLLGVKDKTKGAETMTDNNIYMNGSDLHASTFYATSDERVKNILSSVDVTIEELANLPIFNFTWKDSDNKVNLSGTSALAVKEILPNLVSGDEKLTLNYGALGSIAAIVAAKEIVELKREIAELKSKING